MALRLFHESSMYVVAVSEAAYHNCFQPRAKRKARTMLSVVHLLVTHVVPIPVIRR